MCGLVGIAGDTTGAWKDVYTDLLLIDVLRGAHSTGAGFVNRQTERFDVVKRPGHPFNLFEAGAFQDMMKPGVSSKVILGHNRHATFGEKTEENAHPFMFNHVVGMHNGTLDKTSVYDLHNHHLYGTDSQAIFATINEYGIEETVKRLAGAWALVWYDRRDNTLNFLRNDRRPFHYCYSKDRCTIIWASELDMLKYVLARRNKDVYDNQFYVTTPNIHYSWVVPENINKKFDSPFQVEREGKKWVWQASNRPLVVTKTGGHSGKPTCQTTYPGYTSNYGDDTIVPYHMRRKTDKFRPPYKDQYGRIITKKEIMLMFQVGCTFCDRNDLKWNDFAHVMGRYFGPQTPFMCRECYDDQDYYDVVNYAL